MGLIFGAHMAKSYHTLIPCIIHNWNGQFSMFTKLEHTTELSYYHIISVQYKYSTKSIVDKHYVYDTIVQYCNNVSWYHSVVQNEIRSFCQRLTLATVQYHFTGHRVVAKISEIFCPILVSFVHFFTFHLTVLYSTVLCLYFMIVNTQYSMYCCQSVMWIGDCRFL